MNNRAKSFQLPVNEIPSCEIFDAFVEEFFDFFLNGCRFVNQDDGIGRKVGEERCRGSRGLIRREEAGDDVRSLQLPDRSLGECIKLPDRFDGIPPKLDSDGIVADKRKHIKDAAAYGKISVFLNKVLSLEPERGELVDETAERVFLSGGYFKSAGFEVG